jgi:hypothetical protein
MLRKILFFAGLAASISFTTSANAGWERYPYLSAVYDYKYNGEMIARWLGIRHYAQPTNYTCGSTTSMQILWETHKKGRAIQFNTTSLHNYMNTSGGSNSGLTAEELKTGQKKVVDYINKNIGLGLNVTMTEGKYSTIKDAVFSLARAMNQNFSPAIIYGNVNLPGASAGGHYYLATGAVYCPRGTCSSDLIGLFISDSVYNSPAYSANGAIRNQAIRPRELVWEEDLKFYWQPTGSAYPWRRGHIYLYNSSPRV